MADDGAGRIDDFENRAGLAYLVAIFGGRFPSCATTVVGEAPFSAFSLDDAR